MDRPKTLIFDIETSPMLAYVWGLRDQNIALNQIKEDWYVIAWSAKWLGDPPSKTVYYDLRNAKSKHTDKSILGPMRELLDEADIVITQNGRNFDSKRLNARFILNGMPPPSEYKHWDTLQVVKRVAQFTSNKLEYLTDKLCTKYKKLHHKKFPGMELWKQCLANNPAAWAEMKRYNIHDVLATEELYTKIRAWAPAVTPKIYPTMDPSLKCAVCGIRGRMQKRGTHAKRNGQYQRYQCQNCGAWALGDRIKPGGLK